MTICPANGLSEWPVQHIVTWGPAAGMLTDISINVHSLLLGSDAGIAMEGSSPHPLTATVATSVTLTPGGASRIDAAWATQPRPRSP